MAGKQETESFDDVTPIEITEVKDSTDGSDGMDSFDNIDPKGLENGKSRDEGKDKKKEKEGKGDRQVDQLDEEEVEEKGKDEEGDGEGEAEESASGEEEEDSGKEEDKEDGKEGTPKDADKPKTPNKKYVKGKVDGEDYELDPDTEIRVSIKGKKENVSLRDLMSDYSGGKNWDREYTKMGEERTQLKKEKESYKSELGWFKGHIDKVVEILDSEDSDPTEALMYFLDVTGRDPVKYQQKMFSAQIDQLREMDEMDEIERDLYWEKRKNQSLLKRQESSSNRANAQQERQTLIAKVDGLRKAQNVSEEQYVESHNGLAKLGFKGVTPEQVVDYAVKMPFIIKAEEMIEPYTSEIESSKISKLVSNITSSLFDEIASEEEINNMLKETYGEDEGLKELNDRIRKPRKVTDKRPANQKLKYKAVEEEDHVESFEDFGYI